MHSEAAISPKSRNYIIIASLLALFLGALDALVMSAAMPTIVADLGGLHLYSWVYSAYLLARAVALPVFGKLADIFRSRRLYIISICIFLLGSLLAGLAQSMMQLILSRVLQGIGAGGNFALVYIVLADVSTPEKRGKTLSLGSFIWGLASVLGPTFGGFVVTYFSWRWIFFINVPLGVVSLLGIAVYLVEVRDKKRDAAIDYWGAFTLSSTILGLLTVFLLAGRSYAWISSQIIGLSLITIAAGIAFFYAEKRAREPILSLDFFRTRGFSAGNGSAFLASFTIFSLFAYSPLFIQGGIGQNAVTDERCDAVSEFGMVCWRLGLRTDCQPLRPEAVNCFRLPLSGHWRWNFDHFFNRHLFNGLFCCFGICWRWYGICFDGNPAGGARQP